MISKAKKTKVDGATAAVAWSKAFQKRRRHGLRGLARSSGIFLSGKAG
jgi:hypothetical protein